MTAQQAILELLAERGPGKTICPSEAARIIADDDEWRSCMQDVHEAAERLSASGAIVLSWKGQAKSRPAGPYRIGQGSKKGPKEGPA